GSSATKQSSLFRPLDCFAPKPVEGLAMTNVNSTALDTEFLLRIDHGDDADAAAFAFRPAPGETHEGAALARDLVDIAVDVLDAGDAVGHQHLVRRLPIGEVVDDMTAGLGEVFLIEMRLRRARTMRPQKRAERVVERLDVDAEELDLLLHQPFRA